MNDIRIIKQSEYDDAKRVWRLCFPDDSDEFIDYYFARRTSPELILGAFSRCGELIGTLHLLPREISFLGHPKRICFVAGVGTVQSMRHKGIASAMFEAAYPLMKKRGFCASILQPFNVGFYERLGYEPFVYAGIGEINTACLLDVPLPCVVAPDADKMLSIYNAFMRPFTGFALRDKACFENLISEFSLSGSVTVMTENSYAFCCIEGSCANVYESAGDITTSLTLLASRYSSVKALVPTLYSDVFGVKQSVFNMIKVIDEDVLISHTGFSTASEAVAHAKKTALSFDRY